MKTGIELIAEERKEQIEQHGFTVSGDKSMNSENELRSAAMYVLTANEEYYPSNWDTWFKNKLEDKRARMSPEEFDIERLKIAGALIAADIDQIQLDEPR